MIDYCDAKVTRSQIGRLVKIQALKQRHLSGLVVWYNARKGGVPPWDGMTARIYRQARDDRFQPWIHSPTGMIRNPLYVDDLHWPTVVGAVLTFERQNDALAFYMVHSTDFLAVEFLDESGLVPLAA